MCNSTQKNHTFNCISLSFLQFPLFGKIFLFFSQENRGICVLCDAIPWFPPILSIWNCDFLFFVFVLLGFSIRDSLFQWAITWWCSLTVLHALSLLIQWRRRPRCLSNHLHLRPSWMLTPLGAPTPHRRRIATTRATTRRSSWSRWQSVISARRRMAFPTWRHPAPVAAVLRYQNFVSLMILIC